MKLTEMSASVFNYVKENLITLRRMAEEYPSANWLRLSAEAREA